MHHALSFIDTLDNAISAGNVRINSNRQCRKKQSKDHLFSPHLISYILAPISRTA